MNNKSPITKPVKFDLPKMDIIEHTALQFALTFYEACRNQGMKSKYKTARLWALHNYTKFLPKALETLTDMLGREDIHDNVKAAIHEAILERVNDPVVKQVFPSDALPEIDVKKLLEASPEANIPTIKTDVFDKKKKPLKERLKDNLHNA